MNNIFKTLVLNKWVPTEFHFENVCCLETQQEYENSYDKEDFNLIEIGIIISPEILEKIQYLRVNYSEGKSLKTLQEYLGKMTSLHALLIPSIYMAELHSLTFPSSLKSLIWVNESQFNDYFKQNKKTLLKNKLLKDFKLEHLTFLKFSNLSNAKPIEELVEISPEQFPNLEFVDFINDDKLTFLSQLKAFKTIKHLRFAPVKVPIFEHLACFSDSLETLSLEAVSKDFSLKGIGILKNLQYLWINSTFCQTDCSCLLEAPTLREIILFNGKSVVNVEAILELPNLEALRISDCKTPEKKDLITKEIKKKFLEKGFKSVG